MKQESRGDGAPLWLVLVAIIGAVLLGLIAGMGVANDLRPLPFEG